MQISLEVYKRFGRGYAKAAATEVPIEKRLKDKTFSNMLDTVTNNDPEAKKAFIEGYTEYYESVKSLDQKEKMNIKRTALSFLKRRKK